MSIRAKLTGALIVPLLALLLVTAVEVVRLAREVDDVATQAELAQAALGPGGLINTLQDERSWMAVDLIGSQSMGIKPSAEGYEDTRRATDDALAQLREEVGAHAGTVAEAYAAALEPLDGLDQLRADVDANRSSPAAGTAENNGQAQQFYLRYRDLISPFFGATDQVIDVIEEGRLRRGAELVNALGHNIDLFSDMARHNILVATGGPAGAAPGEWDPASEHDALVERRAHWNANNRTIAQAAVPYDRVVADQFPRDFVTSFTDLTDGVVRGDEIPLDDLIDPLRADDYGGLRSFRAAVSEVVEDTAGDVVADVRRRERAFVLVAASTLVTALALAWVVARSITRPLRSLTRQAKSMAEDRLPVAVASVLDAPLGDDVRVPSAEPVRVRTSDEVAEVADALNVVQDTALDLAVEQAVLRRNIADSFVNLGRRNQNLLVRLLDVITQLERVETDPDALADLYRLDHLATRMRRNAESLLVLAGLAPPRQWSTPVSVADVVRSAIGEVEDYQRVDMAGVEPTTVLGSTASDLAHLLAELIENALRCSPADTVVTIRGRRLDDGTYGLAVFDAGMGMDDESLAAANRRLAGAESFTVAPSKYLGHYVAGNLAARHDIQVQLVASHPGTTATIVLPSRMLASGAPALVRR